MTYPVYLTDAYASRYSLLGAMAHELGEAFAAAGHPVNPDTPPGDEPGVFIWFNFPASIDLIPPRLREAGSPVRLVQVVVDHPYAIDEALTDQLAALPNHRMLLPCIDGAHLLRLRWPTLGHGHMLHAVPGSSVCARVDTPRDTGVIVAGSIHTPEELETLRACLPAALHGACAEMIELLARHPWMPFEQSMDLSLGVRSISTDRWALVAAIWRFVTASVNRRRRTELVHALRGLPVEVWGLDAWRPFCTGTIRYRGAFEYADSGRTLAGAKVSLAWGPTQFTHSFSERVLLSMAAGCATVADDRMLARARLGPGAALYDASRPQDAADLIRDLLHDEPRRLDLARTGRDIVERQHLWEHRLGAFTPMSDAGVSPAVPSAA
jgi:hypothetical protein